MCKINWYNDLPGQQGCKKCGPTAYSEGGAATCKCYGAHRTYIRSLGACLCEKGYKPKDDAPNIDSPYDCEAEVRQVCPPGHDVDAVGDCVGNPAEYDCAQQCRNGGGKLIQGTGMCQCDQINDVDEVCDEACQSTTPRAYLSKTGKLVLSDPVTGKSREVDPSTLPGYYGDFKPKSQVGSTRSNAYFMGLDDGGNFAYDFRPDPVAIRATITEDHTDTSKLLQKLHVDVDGKSLRPKRSLQPESGRKLYNPVICIKEGDSIFFTVHSEKLQYPRYFKDSILNTNQDFDYGPFTELEEMIIAQNITVDSFSYIFRDRGIYVFENAGSGAITIIGVVAESMHCSNSINGIGVSMTTKEALAEIGIKSYDKEIKPNWWFIVLSFLFINGFAYLTILCFILGHKLSSEKRSIRQALLRERRGERDTIYYDRLREMKDEEE